MTYRFDVKPVNFKYLRLGLGVKAPGVQGEHRDLRPDAARHIHEHQVLGPAERDRNLVGGLERQAQEVLGGLAAVNVCIKLDAWRARLSEPLGTIVSARSACRVLGEEVHCTGTRTRR